MTLDEKLTAFLDRAGIAPTHHLTMMYTIPAFHAGAAAMAELFAAGQAPALRGVAREYYLEFHASAVGSIPAGTRRWVVTAYDLYEAKQQVEMPMTYPIECWIAARPATDDELKTVERFQR